MDKLVLAALVLYLATRKRPEPAAPPRKQYLEYEPPPPEYDPGANDLSAGEYLGRCAEYGGAGAGIGIIFSPVGAAIGGVTGCLAGIGTGIYDSWG